MDKIKLAIASDLSGFPLREAIINHLNQKYAESIEIIDFGIESEEHPKPYFEQAPKVAGAVQSGKAAKGILICGTGQGMAIVANKFKGVYASVVDSVFSETVVITTPSGTGIPLFLKVSFAWYSNSFIVHPNYLIFFLSVSAIYLIFQFLNLSKCID